ncbi:ArsR/SmtB family transcription factor [Brachybacterium endophyticum]|uniref:ArsR/SmtB family transcription factor n=1 Tax=Brachybacterium endophyticum TaxID=2182385 RepID=UPI0014037DBB|nr:metalloregulator ArsR/SmtB family transcription factor [Brachybacterium endophyticum]
MPEPADMVRTDVLKALADPVRLQIMDRLAAQPCGVSELSRSLPITRQGTAKHLTVLRRAGLVRSDHGPSGESYRVVPARVDETARTLARAADRWTTQLSLLKAAAEGGRVDGVQDDDAVEDPDGPAPR